VYSLGHLSVLYLLMFVPLLQVLDNLCMVRHPTGPFPVSPVPALAGEVVHRYRL
jgi:hypothetical protein